MVKLVRSFRFKMVMLFGLSSLCAGTITYLVYKALQLYYHTTKFEDPLTKYRQFIRDVGEFNFFLLFFIPLSIYFFFLFTKRYSLYFRDISRGIRQLADGDFTGSIQIRSNDELEDIARDINLASAQLRQAIERGDFAESSKERLVLNLAHDLRTPLTSVIGYLDYILQDKGMTEEQIKHYTGIAFNKSRRLEKLIDELFEIVRMNYGSLKISNKTIDLSELLIQLSEELYPAFEKNQLTTRLHVIPHMQISGDGDLLARVFENLFTNAIRYGKDGEMIDIHCYPDADHAVVQVINYGDSIPPDELPYIFDMFYTGDKARTHREGGSGIGLFIAKHIVGQHQGTITAQSDVIRTVFEVRLPRHSISEDSGEQ